MKTKHKFKRKQNVLSVITKTIDWGLVSIVAILIGVFLSICLCAQLELWLESCGFSTTTAVGISLLVACMPLFIFILVAAVINIMRYLSTCFRVSALPLTQDEFDDATKNMSLLECLQYFNNFISYKMFNKTHFYKGFENWKSPEDLITLLCLIYNKYKDVDNVKIKESKIPEILENYFFRSDHHTFEEFKNQYGIITDVEIADDTANYMDINKICTLIKYLCVE